MFHHAFFGLNVVVASEPDVTKSSGMDAGLNGEPFVYYNFVSDSDLMDAGLNGEPFVYVGDMEDLD